ncbi:hypothetical protein E2C01_080548 [Portunus trituberculatus]|uniref:Uncharacterized protein n=1 Tax=Portunus trituberculatus TaxID=210409 RepID=A0A5B7IUD0_PORTR|nr:hypothetical protein [Portunus trituberculatus]
MMQPRVTCRTDATS